MPVLATVSLVVATLTTGLTAGLLYGFAHTVMPGLARVDDRTFVAAFQSVDRVIVNPWFLVGYLGGPVFTLLAVPAHLGPEHRASLPWLATALALHLLVLGVTARVHLPLNRALHNTPPDSSAADLATARGRFEGRWTRWNVFRTVAAVAAFACLAAALLRSG